VHLKLHAVTAAVYATPEATVAARLLVAILQDVLLPTSTYPAELAGSYVSVSTGPGGLSVKVAGFQGVAQQLLLDVLCGLQSEWQRGGGGVATVPC
jgi:secreted Zn-dependent insulinase-like peptidase